MDVFMVDYFLCPMLRNQLKKRIPPTTEIEAADENNKIFLMFNAFYNELNT
ncbi:MAG: hypothetical protein L0L52_06090 [Staphylococcus equorum]|uniref:hypothetical protein n=1 Tax=Staphylococcus TaxID=1279 RepID=UPI000628A075|nr:hypothetical protein [Staphylococcus equorum]KKI53042.1 hypothetical protein UF72_1903 [Staphylococcus equorum subsp. equorum]MDG0823167.1 hypothetical protein [Staphylococcus equorum]MDG0836332.1 hypothetical protein [Staphylococcus equorum]MDK9872213.1 hypothetical protein [Staphylococcus equorum]MDK9877973.1 hypothetical protein [Staphylococcus equorum]